MSASSAAASRDVALSVVVALVSDTTAHSYDLTHLAGCLRALSGQKGLPHLEVIVPYPAHVDGIEALQRLHPEVRFVAIDNLTSYTGRGGSREHHDELRARGLAVAQGKIIALLEDHARPDPDWSRAMIDAHRAPYAAIGGAIENGIARTLNWAVYYCDFGKYQNPLPSGEARFASDANSSYKRAALMSVQTVWRDFFHETIVNGTLLSRGERLALCPDAIVYQHRENLNLISALQERFIWGCSYAHSRSVGLPLSKRLFYATLSPLLPGLLFVRMVQNAVKKRRYLGSFLKATPVIILLLVFWSLGELSGYLSARSHPAGATSLER